MRIKNLLIIAVIMLSAARVYSALLSNLYEGAELKVSPRNLSDNATHYQVEFGTFSSSNQFEAARQYIELDFKPYKNLPLWKIDIYTNNTASTLPQRGGLTHVSNPDYRLPAAWKVNNTTQTSLTGDPNTPGYGWAWMKDKNDIDLPGTPENESWEAAWSAGDTTVCTGNQSGAVLRDGTPCGTTAYVYLKCNFASAASGNYGGTVWFDMYPVIDVTPPVFTHDPVTRILGRCNLWVIKGDVSDNEKIDYVKLHYSTDVSTWQAVNLALLGNKTNKLFLFMKKLNELGDVKKVYYALEASDGYNTAWYGSLDAPVTVDILDKLTFADIIKGIFEVPDGNPSDGITSISIPDGALDRSIILSIAGMDIGILPPRRKHLSDPGDYPVVAFEFGPEGTKFKVPVTMTILYYDIDNDGEVELADGRKTGINENDLRIYWWDNFEWRLLGGRIDSVKNTLTIQTDHFSAYAVFAQAPMTADDYRPKEKIITPATPGGDDAARFNGLNAADFKIDLFDVTGRKFRTIKSPEIPQWDGKDEDGNIVESGVYIYQFEADIDGHNRLISGTIVVAK